MSTETPNTIRLEIPRQRIAADLQGLIRHLGEAALNGVLLQNWSGVVAGLSNAAATMRIAQSDGALAWQLLLTGIGEALTELSSDQPPNLVDSTIVDLVTERVNLEARDLTISVDFLDHPWTLPPVVLAKQTLLEWLAPPPIAGRQQDLVNLSYRFDSALVLGLRRAIRRDEARYLSLLSLRDDPTSAAWEVLEDWRIYRAQLIAAFRATPVFDESFALDRVYVPLNAWHWKRRVDEFQKGRPKTVRTVVRLTDDILRWMRTASSKDRLRLISGPPGSGKSSAMKALAAELAENGNNQQPTDVLLFPLQRFLWRSGIVESVGATLTEYADQMRHNPLERDHLRSRTAPLLLIFDGLDELSADAEMSEAISATFLRELNTALAIWRDLPVRAIVTGRAAIFGNVEGPTMTLPGERFHLLPYHVGTYDPDGLDQRDYHDPAKVLSHDYRYTAFELFSKAKGAATTEFPDMYNIRELHDVSTQPLLNYFLLTSGSDEPVDGNLARIYSNLFKRLHDRNRNVDDRPEDAGKPGAGLSHALFDRVFEAIAVAAWRNGSARAVNWDAVIAEARREDSYLSDANQTLCNVFETQMRDRGAQKPFRLAAAFFMRNQEATGVEFTHKSFADYLYARRLVKALADMANGLLLTPAVEHEMLCRWEALTADQPITIEVRRFLELEIEATVCAETMEAHHTVLAPVVERVFVNGWRVDAQTARRAEQRSSQMEEALFIAWHALWRPTRTNPHWNLGSNTGDLLRRAVARHESVQGTRDRCIFVSSWTHVNLSLEECRFINLFQGDFRYANMESIDLSYANLIEVDLRGAILKNACLEYAFIVSSNLKRADLVRANLRGARLESANLEYANLDHARLNGAVLKDAELDHATLEGAHLEYADLENATLKGADLEHANLGGSRLNGASFKHANIKHAHLDGAQMVSAELEDSDLERATLAGANLESAGFGGAVLKNANLIEGNLTLATLQSSNLQFARLRGANLDGARLEEANLEGADLNRACLARATLTAACLHRTRLINTNLEGAVLSEAILDDAILQSAILDKACLEGARLVRATLRDARLTDANLRGAILRRARVVGANLEGACIEGADLEGANLMGAKLVDANLMGANLKNANLEDADLEGANLMGAKLEGASLKGANLKGTILEDADVKSAIHVHTSSDGASPNNP